MADESIDTPETLASVEANAEKLSAMLKTGGGDVPDGRTRSTPGAAALSARESAPPVTADETRRQAIMKDPKWLTGDAALLSEMKQILARQATPEEQQNLQEGTLEDHRSAFGIGDPEPLPKFQVEQYNQEYGGWESEFLLAAREHGLDAKTTRDLRDLGVTLGMRVDGKPLPEEELDYELKQFGERLTARQKTALKAYWRRIEGGGAA